MQAPEAKILVVDDDLDALEATAGLLRAAGHEVHLARSAEEADELLGRETYALVITDAALPGGSGVALASRIRRQFPATQVLVASGHPSLPTAIEALKAGAADYLAKPVAAQTLRRIVARLLAEAPTTLSSPAGPPALDEPSSAEGPVLFEVRLGTTMRRVEREVILRTLDALGHNKNRTARVLGISRRALYNKLERFERAAPLAPVTRDTAVAQANHAVHRAASSAQALHGDPRGVWPSETAARAPSSGDGRSTAEDRRAAPARSPR